MVPFLEPFYAHFFLHFHSAAGTVNAYHINEDWKRDENKNQKRTLNKWEEEEEEEDEGERGVEAISVQHHQ